MEGSATFTIVVSSTIIRSPRQRTRSASQRFLASSVFVKECLRRWLLRLGRFENCDVELVHLEHRLHHSPRFRGVLAVKKITQHGRNDLPGYAELVLEPATALLLAVCGELLPQVVDLRLRLAVHEKGDRGRELEMRTAVQRHELLTLD